MNFISNRDIILRSINGHAIEFKKDVSTPVPRALHAECLDKGILPDDKQNLDEVTSAIDPKAPKLAPDEADARNDEILAVIEQIVKRNNPSDFTGGGHPSAVSVSASLGWKADQKEVSDVWKKNREALIKGVDTKTKE